MDPNRCSRLAGIILAAVVLLSACASPGAVPGTATLQPAGSLTSPPPTRPSTSPAAPASPTVPFGPLPAYLQPAQTFLANRMGIQTEQVTLLTSEAVDWPDGCLGVSRPNVMCPQVVTPGYKAVFATPQGEIEVHTNQDGQNYTLALPEPVVDFERTGGIAGICQKLSIGQNGVFLQQDCRGAGAGVIGLLGQEAWKQLHDDLQRFGKVEFQTQMPVPDQFVDQYTLNGQGSAIPSPEEQQALAEFLAGLYDPNLNPDAPATPSGAGGSGITGQVLVGPSCPGPVKPGQDCPDQPFPTTLSILNPATNQAVTQVQTDAQATFRVDLPPGTYLLHPVITGRYPRGDDQTVEVQAGQYTQVEIHLDSGIR